MESKLSLAILTSTHSVPKVKSGAAFSGWIVKLNSELLSLGGRVV